MELDKFQTVYTPKMMEIVKKFDEIQSLKFAEIIKQGDYTKLQSVKHGIEQLAEAKMLLCEYSKALLEEIK